MVVNTMAEIKYDLWLKYRCGLAVFAVFIFFPEIDNYLHLAGMGPIPLAWIVALCIGALPLLRAWSTYSRYYLPAVIKWCALYVGIALFSYCLINGSASAFQEVKDRILSVIFILVTTLVFSGNNAVLLWARRAILCIVFITILGNLYETVVPNAFAGLNDSGRPASFYLDANRSACSLIMGMIFSIELLRKQWRLLFSLLTFIGVIATFSRGAILAFPFVFIFLIYKKIIPRKQLAIGLSSLIFITTFFGFSGEMLGNLLANLNLDGLDFQRLDMLINPGSSLTDDSSAERQTVLLEAWKRFLNRPFLGNGAGYIKGWELPVGPHNMYFLHMADHGFLGFLIYPTFLLTTFWGSQKHARDLGIALLILMVPWGLFSHAVLTERNALLIFSLLSVMNATTQTESRAKPAG